MEWSDHEVYQIDQRKITEHWEGEGKKLIWQLALLLQEEKNVLKQIHRWANWSPKEKAVFTWASLGLSLA